MNKGPISRKSPTQSPAKDNTISISVLKLQQGKAIFFSLFSFTLLLYDKCFILKCMKYINALHCISFLCASVCECGWGYTHNWGSEDNLQEPILSFHRMGLGAQTWVWNLKSNTFPSCATSQADSVNPSLSTLTFKVYRNDDRSKNFSQIRMSLY